MASFLLSVTTRCSAHNCLTSYLASSSGLSWSTGQWSQHHRGLRGEAGIYFHESENPSVWGMSPKRCISPAVSSCDGRSVILRDTSLVDVASPCDPQCVCVLCFLQLTLGLTGQDLTAWIQCSFLGQKLQSLWRAGTCAFLSSFTVCSLQLQDLALMHFPLDSYWRNLLQEICYDSPKKRCNMPRKSSD